MHSGDRTYTTFALLLMMMVALAFQLTVKLKDVEEQHAFEIVDMWQENETCYMIVRIDTYALAGTNQIRVYHVIAVKDGREVVFKPVYGNFTVVAGEEAIRLRADAPCPYYPDSIKIEAEKPAGSSWVPVFLPVFYPVPMR